MSILAYKLEIRELIRGYLSVLDKTPRFLAGAFVKVSYGRLQIEHDDGWTALVSTDAVHTLLDYTEDGKFTGAAGLEALLDWLRP